MTRREPAASLRRRPRTEAGAELRGWREPRRRDASRAGDGPGLPHASLRVLSCKRGLRVRPSHSVVVITSAPGGEGVWSLLAASGVGLDSDPGARPFPGEPSPDALGRTFAVGPGGAGCWPPPLLLLLPWPEIEKFPREDRLDCEVGGMLAGQV